MKHITLLTAAFSALFASLSVPAQLQSDFNQTVYNYENNQTLHYSGKLALKSPGSAKWIYNTPVKKIICLLDKNAWIIEPELEQATRFRLKKTIPLLSIMKKAKEISSSKYKARYEGIYYTIIVDKKQRLKRIIYKDALGNRVVLDFENMSTKRFEAKVLKCVIPPDYDIIDGRH